MNFERFFNSKFYKFLELLYRLIITNIFGILATLLGLGIFSLMSSLVSMIIILKSINTNTEFPIIKVFFRSFIKNYKRIVPLSLFYYGLTLLAIFNFFFFREGFIEFGTVVNEIAFYLSIAIVLIIIAAFINACYIYVYFPNLNNKKIIKYSFSLFRVIIIQMFVMIVYILLAIFLLYVFPYILIFLYFSLGLLIINLLIRFTYQKLVADGVTSLDAFMYK